jgi:catechol 2,3-dioxygenase-like lactoylglutathione lyase family enzyme
VSEAALRPRGIHHVAIQVRDLAAMEAFYGGVLGLGVLRRWQGEDGERSIWFDLGGAFLAIERVAGAPRPREGFYTDDLGIHLVALAIQRGDRDSWEAHLTAAGHEIVHHTDYTLYVRDPEGNRVGLSHWPDGTAP